MGRGRDTDDRTSQSARANVISGAVTPQEAGRCDALDGGASGGELRDTFNLDDDNTAYSINLLVCDVHAVDSKTCDCERQFAILNSRDLRSSITLLRESFTPSNVRGSGTDGAGCRIPPRPMLPVLRGFKVLAATFCGSLLRCAPRVLEAPPKFKRQGPCACPRTVQTFYPSSRKPHGRALGRSGGP